MRRYDKVVRQTYDREQDTFRYGFLVAPCFVLALLINHKFTLTEVQRARAACGRLCWLSFTWPPARRGGGWRARGARCTVPQPPAASQ